MTSGRGLSINQENGAQHENREAALGGENKNDR
jgi:hypothetical protein